MKYSFNEIWQARARRTFGGLSVMAAMLAIASIDTVWIDRSEIARHEVHELVRISESTWRAKRPQKADALASVLDDQVVAKKPLQSALSRSLEHDELQEQNPFANLSSQDPLQAILRKGVSHLHRVTFRSPTYKEESGYDMISYEIEHPDRSRSSILAYLDKYSELSSEDTEASEDAVERLPFVAFMVSSGEVTEFSFYRGGNLVEQSDLTHAEAQAFVAQRLRDGIPFLNVAR